MEENEQKPYTFSDDEAFATIGEAYYRGFGMMRNYDEAFRFYRKAAAMGNPAAMRRLGDCFLLGRGTKPDAETALSWYENASEKGDASATLRIGDFYRDGFNALITKDNQKATDLYLTALQQAKKNYDVWNAPDIYLRIGDCMREGIGIEKDIEGAYDFYEAAANLFAERMDSGDSESEELLEKADQGMKTCSEMLGVTEELSNEPFDA